MTATIGQILQPDGWQEAMDTLPPAGRVHTVGTHTLYRLSMAWFVLAGPDDTTRLAWVEDYLPSGHVWIATFETFARTLLTHFTPN